MLSTVVAALASLAVIVVTAAETPAPVRPTVVETEAPGSSWHAVVDRPWAERANAALFTSDGGLIIAGGAYDRLGDGFTDAYLLRLSADGGLISERRIQSPGEDEIFALAPAPAGSVYAVGRHDYKFSVARLDLAGFVLWRALVAGETPNNATAVAEAPSGGVYAAGDLGGDVLVVRFGADGQEAWRRGFGGASTKEAAVAAAATSDGGVVVVTSTERRRRTDYSLMKLSAQGEAQWRENLDLDGAGWINAVAVSDDGRIYAAGGLSGDALVIALTNNGQEIWRRRYNPGRADQANALAATPDGGFLLSGDAGARRSDGGNAWAMLADQDGSEIWRVVIDGQRRDTFLAAAISGAGSMAIAGHAYIDDLGQSDVRTIRIAPGDGAPEMEAETVQPPPGVMATAQLNPPTAALDDDSADAAGGDADDASASDSTTGIAEEVEDAAPPEGAFACKIYCRSANEYSIPYSIEQQIVLEDSDAEAASLEASTFADEACQLSGGVLDEMADAPATCAEAL